MPAKLKGMATPIDTLVPDPQNARLHDERNIEAVAKSLKTFGWRQFVVARQSDRVVLAGNARIKAAQQIGWTHAPVMFVSDDEATSRAYAIADNRTAELATWDMDELLQQLTDLGSDQDLMDVTGFTSDEFDALSDELADHPTEAIDDEDDDDDTSATMLGLADVTVKEPTADVQTGDVWMLGKHMLFVCSVIDEWSKWGPHLDGDALFIPYPSPFASVSIKAKDHRMVMVQPDVYIAGHCIDRWTEQNPKAKVTCKRLK